MTPDLTMIFPKSSIRNRQIHGLDVSGSSFRQYFWIILFKHCWIPINSAFIINSIPKIYAFCTLSRFAICGILCLLQFAYSLDAIAFLAPTPVIGQIGHQYNYTFRCSLTLAFFLVSKSSDGLCRVIYLMRYMNNRFLMLKMDEKGYKWMNMDEIV